MSLGDTLTITIEANENTAQLQINDTGTGLGLVVCKRIIEIYNGQITIESTENIGTTVCIILPLHSNHPFFYGMITL